MRLLVVRHAWELARRTLPLCKSTTSWRLGNCGKQALMRSALPASTFPNAVRLPDLRYVSSQHSPFGVSIASTIFSQPSTPKILHLGSPLTLKQTACVSERSLHSRLIQPEAPISRHLDLLSDKLRVGRSRLTPTLLSRISMAPALEFTLPTHTPNCGSALQNRKPRVVSLLPSACELLCFIPGGEELLVGRGHEDDYPPSILDRPVLTASKVNWTTSAGGTAFSNFDSNFDQSSVLCQCGSGSLIVQKAVN